MSQLRNLFPITRKPDAASTNLSGGRNVARSVWRLTLSFALVLIWVNVAFAIPLAKYREHVKTAISALDLLHDTELEAPDNREAFLAANLRVARAELPREVTVEWEGTNFKVDNSWFDDGLKELEKVAASKSHRTPLLDQLLERLQALDERLNEIDQAVTSASNEKGEWRERLGAILDRSEYTRVVKEESAFSKVRRKLIEWLLKLLPKRRSTSPGGTSLVSLLTQVFMLLIALAAIAYAVRMFAPRFLNRRKARKTSKPEARVVLGERLEPDQSAADLLAEAEALARAGDLRGAIRRGYIALLIELAERKIISLAQHKTNRDYLGAVRESQSLHRNMEALTNNFERHWYGLVPANENDWVAFRAGYKEAITST